MTVNLEVKIDSGASLILYVLCYFGTIIAAAVFPDVMENITPLLTALTGAFGGYLLKKNSDNKLDVQVAKDGTAQAINQIKMQAKGEAPCP